MLKLKKLNWHLCRLPDPYQFYNEEYFRNNKMYCTCLKCGKKYKIHVSRLGSVYWNACSDEEYRKQ